MRPQLQHDGSFTRDTLHILARIDAVTTTIHERIDGLEQRLHDALNSQGGGGELLGKAAVAQLLSVSKRTIDRCVADGSLPPGRRIGRAQRWTREEVLKATAHSQGRRG